MKKIIVASNNPVKIKTTEIGFTKMFPDEVFSVEGFLAKSDVSDQPMSERETLQGAINRAKNVAKQHPKADYWVGIEGGLEQIDHGMEVFAWIVITSKNGTMGKGRTGSFFLPKKIVKLIKEGVELGEADDIVFGRTNSKQSNGSVGILTNDVLTRVSLYEQAVILALIPFKNQELF